jgi:cysteinyl-tRNA synthetase
MENYQGRSIDDMIAGARVEVAPYKRNPMDFVLWKPSNNDQPGWESPWGFGRPGWHIECSAMARALFGEKFDIHGGGLDLQFPHHENEIAQSCACCGQDSFANVWLHNEMLQVEGKKMSKSLGNFFSVKELLDKGFSGEVVRFVYLSTHYSKPMDWTVKKAEEAELTLRKWRKLTNGVQDTKHISKGVIDALNDDLNTSKAITVLHGLAKSGNIEELKSSAQILGLLSDQMGAWVKENTFDLSKLEEIILASRDKAMKTKEFTELDNLKNLFISAGLDVQMSKDGIKLIKGPKFNSSLLEDFL